MGRRKQPAKMTFQGADKIKTLNDDIELAVIPGEQTQKESSREELFIRNLFLDMDLKTAALKAGYSESYATSTLYQKFKSPKFQNRIRDFAASLNYSFLPKVLNIHRLGLEAIEKDLKEGGTEKASKLKHISRDSLRMAGLLHEDVPVQNINFVDVKALQVIIQRNLGMIDEDGNDNGEPDKN